MANEKLYYPQTFPTDRQILHEDGGGIIMTNQGKFMLSSLSKEKLDELKELQYNGLLPTDFNDVSIIGIMNQGSSPQNNILEGSTNRTTLINPTGLSTPPPQSNNICGGEGVNNKEFEEASKIFSLWEELNSNASANPQITLNFYDNNKYVKSSDQLNKLFIPTDLQQIISSVGLNGSNFKNLGWGPYGSGESSLISNIGNFYGNYWETNAKNDLANIGTNYQKQFTQVSTNQKINKSVFDIQTLPSGIRTICLRTNYNSGKLWVNRLLTAVGPDYMNEPNLGITTLESREGSGGLPFPVKAQKFFDQYDQIIALYNKDKQQFLEQLALETKAFTVRLVNQGSDPRFKAQPNAFKDFYSIYVDLSLAIALKYKDCPNEFEVVGNVQQTKVTPPPPSPPVKTVTNNNVTKTIEEEGGEGLYQIEFDALPTNENDVEDNFVNTGVDNPELSGGVDDPETLKLVSRGNVIDISNESKIKVNLNTVTISLGTATSGGAVGGSLYTIKSTGVVSSDVNNALKSCKVGANSALDVAVMMNPRGAGIFNPALPEWRYDGNNLILNAIVNKLGCPQNLFCGAGVSLSFIIFNQTDFINKSSSAGGFPVSNSSYIAPTKEFTGNKILWEADVDFNNSNKTLTASGLAKFEQGKAFKGGIFNVGVGGAGHIGMVWYMVLEDYINKKGVNLGKRGYFYSIEFNTSPQNQSMGGQVAFRKRLIGAEWGSRIGQGYRRVWLGDTSGYTGGAWAPNGLGNNNSYIFGNSLDYIKNVTR